MDYFAFYWTLPVPWAGFTSLPKDVDEAAKASRTIRYQVARVRRWVADQKGCLLGEEVFLELQPDRGSEQIVPVIDKLIAKAKAKSASVVLVDFSEAMRWRRHGPLWDRLEASGIAVALDPTPVQMPEEELDPIDHFRSWRRLERLHAETKGDRKAALAAAIMDLRDEGLSFAAIASELNAAGMTTPTGKAWTADNVRKLIVGPAHSSRNNPTKCVTSRDRWSALTT